MNPEAIAAIVTETTLATLTDTELAQFVLHTNLGSDPRNLPFYRKISGLFHANDGRGMPQMHAVVSSALFAYVNKRMEASNAAD